MKDEIKEILDNVKKCCDITKGQSFTVYQRQDILALLDYITNLQQENEKLKEILENLTTMTACGDNKQIKNTAQYKLDIYKSRIDKAIEYCDKEIGNNIANFDYIDTKDLENVRKILKGDDENEE